MFGPKKPGRELPFDRVRAMMRSGMSEKDIVRQLKTEGYSFGEIEKSLMEVVKTSASSLPTGAELGNTQRGIPEQYQQPPQPAEQAPVEQPPQENIAPRPESEQQIFPPYAPPQYEQYQPAQASYPPMQAYQQYPQHDEFQPEVIMEELIESVIEEKFGKFTSDMRRLEDSLNKLRSDITSISEKSESRPLPELPKDLSDRLDSFETRIGGLEKAFKQFVPQLSEHMTAIAKMLAERRQSQIQSILQPRQQSQFRQQQPRQSQQPQFSFQQQSKPQQPQQRSQQPKQRTQP